jgi:hypothetical protein
MRHLISIAICCSLYACGDGAGASDPADLIGTWREIPSSFNSDTPIDMRTLITLNDDGTYFIDERDGGTDEMASYTATGDTITLTGTEDGKTSTIIENYIATDDRFMMGALFPQGSIAGDGVVGSWRGSVTFNDDKITLTLDFHTDNTVHYETKGGKPTDDRIKDGTWKFEADDVVASFVDGSTTINIHMQQFDGRALGGPLYEKI